MNKTSAEIKKTYNTVMVIDEQGIRRLYNEIREQISENNTDFVIRLKIEYADNSSVETLELEDIIKEENRNGREIVKISFEGESKNKTISISFGNYYDNRNKFEGVVLEIVGPDRQWIYIAKSIIEERIKSFEKSSLRSGTAVLFAFLTIMFVTYLSFSYLRSQLSIEFIFEKNQHGIETFSLIGIIIVVIYIIFSFALSSLVGKLFPSITFSIGKGIERYNSILKMRKDLIWGIAIALIISVIGPHLARIVGL